MSSLFLTFLIPSSSQTCNSTTFSKNRLYSTCTQLPVLNSFLHWNYHQSNRTVDLAYRHTGVTSSNWVAWAVNIQGSGMTDAQALVAFQNSGGNMQAFTSPVRDTSISTLTQGTLSFNAPSITAEFISNEIIIYATIELPGDGTSFNQVWQIGPLSGDNPAAHSLSGANVLSPPNLLPVEEESGVIYQSVVQGKRSFPQPSPQSADVLKVDDVAYQAKYQSPVKQGRSIMMSFDFSDESKALTSYCRGIGRDHREGSDPPKLLNLFM